MIIRHAIKPIGERFVLNIVKENIKERKFSYNFDVDHNYILTSLEVTKTISDLVDSVLIVTISRIEECAGGERNTVLISSVVFGASTMINVDAKNSVNIPTGTRKVSEIMFSEGTETDPLTEIVLNKKHSLLVDVLIESYKSATDDKLSASCIVVGNFIRITDLTTV